MSVSDIDLYEILGIKSNASQEEVVKAYHGLSKKCHPSKKGGNQDLFMIITEAYEILNKPEERKKYDKMTKLNLTSQNNFTNLKDISQTYQKSVKTDATDDDVKKFKADFLTQDKKHGFRREDYEKPAVSTSEAKGKFAQLQSDRLSDEKQYAPERVLDPKNLDMNMFNSLFDAMHKNTDKKSGVSNYEDPFAWNGTMNNNGGLAAYSTIGEEDELYSEKEHYGVEKDNYYGKNDSGFLKQNSAREILEAGLEKSDYYSQHNNRGENYKKDLKEKIANRQNETDLIGKMNPQDYQKQNFGAYGVFDQLGLRFDTLTISEQADEREEDIDKKYKKILSDMNKKK